MAYGESNSHVTDDVTWPRKVKLVTPIRLDTIYQKRLEIETPFQKATNRKWPTGKRNGHVTDDVKWPWKSSLQLA